MPFELQSISEGREMTVRTARTGSVLIASILLLAIMSALAVCLATASTSNLQVADNHRAANRAFASAESGLEIMRYWLRRVEMPSTTPPEQYFNTVIAMVCDDLQAAGVSNFAVDPSGRIPTCVLESITGEWFGGQWSADPNDPTVLRVTTTGSSPGASRTITVNFSIEPYWFPIFNYGIATKGPLVLPGSSKFVAASESWEADVYTESANSLIAVDIGKNATFAGDIDIGNPLASIGNMGALDLGGEVYSLQEQDRPEFPVPDIQHFRAYATGPVIDADTDISGSNITLVNAVIAAGTNPKFPGNANIDGILYIEPPNNVTFAGNINLRGIIVAQGDVNDPGSNQINFGDPTTPQVPSNFVSGPYPPGEEFDAMRCETGSCVLAPGFAVSFWKNISAANGVIAASGLRFDKNANAKVAGTLIDYSEQPTVVNGNINMTFDRASMVEIPAGFDLLRVVEYDPTSYAMLF